MPEWISPDKEFQLCADAIQEEGYEKIALYGYPNSLFSHAARLQEDGSWTSKLGKIEDIRHQNLAVLEGPHPAYGQVQCFMKRAMANP